jgi:hypothetical protein
MINHFFTLGGSPRGKSCNPAEFIYNKLQPGIIIKDLDKFIKSIIINCNPAVFIKDLYKFINSYIIATRHYIKRLSEKSYQNCNPAVFQGKGELQILGFGAESQHIVG